MAQDKPVKSMNKRSLQDNESQDIERYEPQQATMPDDIVDQHCFSAKNNQVLSNEITDND